MKRISIIFTWQNLAFIFGVIFTVVLIVHFMGKSVQPATITWADPSQAEMSATERDVKYSYDVLAKTEEITSIANLKAEIVKLDADIKNIKDGATSQILGLQGQRQRKVDMIKQIKAVLEIIEP